MYNETLISWKVGRRHVVSRKVSESERDVEGIAMAGRQSPRRGMCRVWRVVRRRALAATCPSCWFYSADRMFRGLLAGGAGVWEGVGAGAKKGVGERRGRGWGHSKEGETCVLACRRSRSLSCCLGFCYTLS